ncbi:Formyltransferase [Hypomontagnella monticulosa]|nr:Formyltransferase [Hypomontagnella monticulosa]
MQSPLRRGAAVALRSRPWLELSRPLAEVNVLYTRPNSLSPICTYTRRPTRSPDMCCRRHQMRGYSSGVRKEAKNATAPRTQGEATGRKIKKSKPLRILFCGSDDFSCASLEALHREHVDNPGLIQSIDVVVRPGKRTGRGLKVIQHPPLRDLATKLGLPIHERDTFTGWDMPKHINLIIAVSFGLFVPPRLLRAAAYGGLNVHPSILPDLRGPAPLQHALLAGRAATGVTLQTLDAERFDHGLALARSKLVPIPEDDDFAALLSRVTPIGAELLVSGLRESVHVPPLEEIPIPRPAPWEDRSPTLNPGPSKEEGKRGGKAAEKQEEGKKLLHAAKITKDDLRLRPEHLPHLLRRHRALGPLWFWSRDQLGHRKRVIIEQASAATTPEMPRWSPWMPTVTVYADDTKKRKQHILDSLYELGHDFVVVAFPQDADVDLKKMMKQQKKEEEEERKKMKNNGKDNNEAAQEREGETYMVLYNPRSVVGNDPGMFYVQGCRLDTLKVEGEKARPAAQVLRGFCIDKMFLSWDADNQIRRKQWLAAKYQSGAASEGNE